MEYLAIIFYFISIIILGYRLKTKEKKHFLISMSFVVIGSFITYIITPSLITILFLIACVLSFIGDLVMARVIRLTNNRIADGAIVFGTAHITYIYAFIRLGYGYLSPFYTISGILLAFIFYYIIGYNPSLKPIMKIVNYVYALLITMLLMSVISFNQLDNISIYIRLSSIMGIVLFMMSDGLIAYNEFKKKLDGVNEIIIPTYLFAQVLLQMVPVLIILV